MKFVCQINTIQQYDQAVLMIEALAVSLLKSKNLKLVDCEVKRDDISTSDIFSVLGIQTEVDFETWIGKIEIELAYREE